MKIMVLNLGSTSFKYKLFDMEEGERVLSSGGVENIGAPQSPYRIRLPQEERGEAPCPRHEDAFELCLQWMLRHGVLKDLSELAAIGYKAVHGGALSGAQRVGEEVLAQMEAHVSFAPAHNPMYLRMMRAMGERYPQVPQVACFETAFHATQPEYRAVYGVPYEWKQRYGVRRYGFHGSSHSYIAWKMQQDAPECRRIISCHLGGSSSLCAIQDGKSIAASMGATPQSGLFQNNRVGDFDVFCLPALAEKLGGMEQVLAALSSQSGFLGLSGVSNDLRDVEAAAQAGNARAQLSLDAFADNIVGYIGMYTAYLGGLDAVVFTGGIGLNSTVIRQAVCEKLGFAGAKLDAAANVRGREGRMDAPESRVQIWALETNEELMVARGTKACLGL